MKLKLTSSGLALVDELLEQRQQVQKLLVISVVKPALDRDAVVDLQKDGSTSVQPQVPERKTGHIIQANR